MFQAVRPVVGKANCQDSVAILWWLRLRSEDGVRKRRWRIVVVE